jgi:hypothetical protein
MWDNKKLIQILRYYSTVSIVICLFFVMEVNSYFPPVSLIVNPTIQYLKQQKKILPTKDKKEEISRLIVHQKIVLRHDKYISNIKFSVEVLSILFLFISTILYILSTRQLKLNTNETLERNSLP